MKYIFYHLADHFLIKLIIRTAAVTKTLVQQVSGAHYGFVINVLHLWSHLMLTAAILKGNNKSSHFTDKDAEVQMNWVTGSRSDSQKNVQLELHSIQPIPNPMLFSTREYWQKWHLRWWNLHVIKALDTNSYHWHFLNLRVLVCDTSMTFYLYLHGFCHKQCFHFYLLKYKFLCYIIHCFIRVMVFPETILFSILITLEF